MDIDKFAESVSKMAEVFANAIIAITEAFDSLRRLISYIYEDVFSFVVSLVREIKRYSWSCINKSLRIYSPSLGKIPDVKWHWERPHRPCRKVYDRYTVVIYHTKERRK